jgi:hypothetical protein
MTLIRLYEAIPKVIPKAIPARKGVMLYVLQPEMSASVVENSACFVLSFQDNGILF